MLDNSIGYDPPIYIEGVVLSQYKTFSGRNLHVFHEFEAVQIRIQKAGFGLGTLELPMFVETQQGFRFIGKTK